MTSKSVIQIQKRLAVEPDLPTQLVDMLIAIALKRGVSPHQVAREAAEAFAWDEGTWFLSVRPELERSVLFAGGDS